MTYWIRYTDDEDSVETSEEYCLLARDEPSVVDHALIAAIELIRHSSAVGLIVDRRLPAQLAGLVNEYSNRAGKRVHFMAPKQRIEASCESWQRRYAQARRKAIAHYAGGAPDEPSVITINVFEHRCFAACRFCPQAFKPEQVRHREISDSLFQRIVGQLPDTPITVRFGTGGEPLDYPRIFQLIAYLKQQRPNCYSQLATNGVLLDNNRGQDLLNAGLDHLSVSVNAPDASSYRWFAKIDAFDRVVRNLRSFARQRRHSKLRVSANLLDIVRWQDRLDDAIELFTPLVDEVVIGDVKFVDDPELINRHQPATRLPHVPSCSFLNQIMTIDTDGEALVCCAPEFSDTAKLPLGNLVRDHYLTIWNNDRYRQLREKNAAGLAVIPDCHSCRIDQPGLIEDTLRKAAARENMAPKGLGKN